jgi:hypothetical protein
MSRRTYPVPNRNISGSDYIEIKRAKQVFSGTSNLAKTIIQQNGNFPLLTPSGKLKPYQGTYGLSGRTEDGNKTYCLNTSHSYRDLLSITKGKYLLTPPNISNDNFIQFNDVSDAQKLYNGLYYVYTYSNHNLLEYMSPGYPLSGGYPSTTSSYVPNQIQYSVLSDANQRIIVDPTYTITYSSQSCVLHPNVGKDITINNDYESKFSFNRTINLDLLTGFQFPIKFNMAYEEGDCINANNDIQGDYAFPASPTNISPPVITGVVVSSVLKLSVTNVGTWTGVPVPTTFYYQWYRNSTLILLANIYEYLVNPGTDLNANITCKVTGINSSGSATATSNIIVPAIPANTIAPSITPTTIAAGSSTQLTCNPGSWSGYPAPDPITGYAYQWYRGASQISGATNNTYTTLIPTDIAQTITCRVVASNLFGSSSPPTPTSNSVIPTGSPINTAAPVITGSPPYLVGTSLSTTNGTWTAYMPITGYTYQWFRNVTIPIGTNINSYTIVSGDIGQDITCKVTATNPSGSTAATSNILTPSGPPVNTASPDISGNLVVGNTLTTTNGTWSGSPTSFTYTYQWKNNGVSISGATGNTYTTQAADIGQSITCEVKAVNGITPDGVAPSNALTPTSVPTISVAPDISGNLVVGNTLTTTNGTWTASPTTPPLTYNYQWYRGASSISGATGNTYTTQAADIGQSITCEVTAVNGVISSSPAPSNALTPTSVPTNSVAPSIIPTTIVAGSGNTLTCNSNGTWTASPTTPPLTYNYQWYRGASTISGETNITYVTQSPVDQGQSITCQVTAVNGVISSSPATSNAVTPT